MRMPKLIAIVHIPDAMILIVPLCTLHAIHKAAPLEVAKLSRRRIPSPRSIGNRRTLLISGRRSRGWSILRERRAYTYDHR